MAPSGADESPMRADALMVRLGLAASRDRAQALIAEGGVLVEGMPLAKPAKKLPADAEITMTTVDIPWVSRGALKLVGGLEAFPVIDPEGLSCADIGASTGGFTEVLLSGEHCKLCKNTALGLIAGVTGNGGATSVAM